MHGEVKVAGRGGHPGPAGEDEPSYAIVLVEDTKNAPVGFDYSTLPADTAEEIKVIATRIRGRTRDLYVALGQDLIKVHEKLSHGLFGAWVKREFNWTRRTASNFMAAAKLAAEHGEIISNLAPTVVYKIASPSTPESARREVIDRVGSGQKMTVKKVKSIVATHASRAVSRESTTEPASLPAMPRLTSSASDLVPPTQPSAEIPKNISLVKETDSSRQEKLRSEEQQREQVAEQVADYLLEMCGPTVTHLLDLMARTPWYMVTAKVRARLSSMKPGP